MKHMKRMAAIFLAMILALGLALPAQAATKPPADPQGPGGDYWGLNEYPVIIIHGIGQSEVFLYKEGTNEKVPGPDGKPIQGWPPKIDINGLIPKLIFPLLGSLLLQCDIGLTKALRNIVPEILDVFAMNLDGKPAKNMLVEKWHAYDGAPTSLKRLGQIAKEQADRAYDHIPLKDMSDLIDEENVYYFAYDSFGNMEDIVADLRWLINEITTGPGKPEKVNIIPISLGGTIMNHFVEWNKDMWPKLNSVVYAIAALDGSNLVGDLYTYKFALDNESLYRTMIPGLLDGDYLGYLLNVVIRLLPKRLVMKVVDAVIDGVVGGVVSRSTMIWALLPSAYYEEAVGLWLSDPAMGNIKAQVARYRTAQANSRKNIEDMRKPENGIKCYAIAEYNFPMYNFVQAAKLPSGALASSDGLLQLDSPSMGATSWGIDVVKPGYDPALRLKYMCPYGLVDASTCTLPDYTWFFKDQDHERTGRCDVIMRLVMRLACGEADPTAVPSDTYMPEWPQFNYGRDGRWFAQHATNWAKSVIAGTAERVKYPLSAADQAEFDAAYRDIQAAVKRTIVDQAKDQAAKDRFTAIMVKIGAWDPPGQPSFWEKAGDKASWFLSEALYFAYGARGFIDPFWRIWCY